MVLVVSVTKIMPTLNLQSVERNSDLSVTVTLQFVVYRGGTSVAVMVMLVTSAVGLRLCEPFRLFVKLFVSVMVRLYMAGAEPLTTVVAAALRGESPKHNADAIR